MNLREELLRVYEDARSNRSSEDNETTDRAAAELFNAGTADRAKAVGDVAPVFSLPSATGETVTLSDLLEDGPVVLSFYRGSWCPYCNLELRALQANIMEFKARNARLVAISPQVPDESLSTAEKHSLTFDVLSDVGAIVSQSYGLSFVIPAELAALYERRGHDLIRRNGGDGRTLVIPATYVIRQSGSISWSFVDSDHTRRAEPRDIIAALDAIR